MNPSNSLTTSTRRPVALRDNSDALRLLALSQLRGWDFEVLGQAPMPTEPVRLGDWLIIPAHQDTSPIPAGALERVQALYQAGVRPKGFVLVHEAPMLLAAPKTAEPGPKPWQQVSPELKATLVQVGGVLAIGATLLAAVAAVMVPLILAAAASAATIDPILIAVTEDNEWVEIDRWEV